MNTICNVYFLHMTLFICICVQSSFGITMGRKSTIKIGDRFGKLEVLEVLPSIGSGNHSKIECKCECGNITTISSHLLKTKIKSCGCSKNLYEDLVGKTYGKVQIVSLHSEIKTKREIQRKYNCLCNTCGETHIYETAVIRRKGFTGCRCSDNTSTKRYIFSNYKRNADKKSREFSLTFEEFIELCERDCYYCGESPTNIINKSDLYGSWIYNGVDRLDNKIGYTKQNSVSCCKTCNMMKRDMTLNEFISKIKSIHSHISEAIGWGT